MKLCRYAIVLLLVAAMVVSCAPAATPTPVPQPTKAQAQPTAAPPTTVPPTAAPTAKPQPPIKIGMLNDVSAGLVTYAVMAQRGFELGLDYATKGTRKVAGRDIQLIIKDDEGKADVAVTRARELIEKDGADILTGLQSSAVALAAMAVPKEYKKLLVITTAAADQITGANFNRYTFRTGSTAYQDALAGAKFAARTLGKKFVYFAPDNAWGKDQIAAWKKLVEAEGATSLAEIVAPADTTDFTPYLQKVLAANGEVLFIAWAGVGGVQLFQQCQDLGVTAKMKVTTGIVDNAALAATGTAMIGFKGMQKYHYTFPKNPVNDWLVAEHQKRYNAPPDLFTDTAFAAAQAIVAALEKSGGNTDAEVLIPILEGMCWDAPKGQMCFRKEDHQALQPMYAAEVTKGPDGKPLPVKVAEISKEDTAPPITVPKQ